MKKDETNQQARDDRIELSKLKMPLVLRDYQNQFDSLNREYDRRGKLYQWQVTVVIGLAVVLSRFDPIPELGWLPLVFTVIMFWILDGRRTHQTDIYSNRALDIERRFSVDELHDFSSTISKWKFSLTQAHRTSRPNPYKESMLCGLRPSKLIWHGGLTATSLLVFFVVHP